MLEKLLERSSGSLLGCERTADDDKGEEFEVMPRKVPKVFDSKFA